MTLYQETPCEECDRTHVGGGWWTPGGGCDERPGGSREEVTIDIKAGVAMWKQRVTYRPSHPTIESIVESVVLAALGVPEDE